MGPAKDKRRRWEVCCLMNELVTKLAFSCFVVPESPMVHREVLLKLLVNNKHESSLEIYLVMCR